MDTNKTFIFMVAIASVLIIFLLFTNKPEKQTVTNVSTTTTVEENVKETKTVISNSSVSGFEFVETKQDKEYDMVYENSYYKIVFDPKNATIQNAFIKTDKERIVDLVQGKDGIGSLDIKLGSWDNDLTINKITGGKSYYYYSRDKNNFVFSCKFKNLSDNNIFTVTKTFTFLDNENLFKLNISISNENNKAVNFDNSKMAFSIGWGPLLGLESKEKNYKPIYDNLAYFKGNKVKKIPINDNLIKKNNNFYLVSQEGNDSWIANSEHFFVSIIYPDSNRYKYFFDYRDVKDQYYYCGLSRDTNEISKINSEFYVYLGPKEEASLSKYNDPKNNFFGIKDAKFEMINDYFMGHSVTWFLESTVGWFITWIAGIFKNYGIAIIIVTFIIKLLLSPLTHSSMMSQEKMKNLQPKMKELQAKYKDKPEELNKETMNLYKKEGVNPFAGCLPLLLQMPILTAMYYLLANMYSLNGASFLWIHDLSKPDAIFDFSNYFVIPFVNISTINIMPIIMTFVSIVSTFTTPDTSGNQQAKMMMWMMPLIFFFLFYNVSSGLVLYWTIMNILNLAQQIYINYFRKKLIKAKT
jgi:YidC/Oxa1 family membrane protein insertase